jgi:outer membrane protein TolC
MRVTCQLLLACGALGLSGCQHFEPRPISADQNAVELETRSLRDAGLKSYVEKNLAREIGSWQRWNFEMLTLAAFYFHPSLDIARAQRDVAKAAIGTAGGRPNPTIGVTPAYSFNPPEGMSPWLPSVTFDVPIETAGKRSHRLARAGQLSDAALFNIATTAWAVRSRLRAALLELADARQREEVLRQQHSLQEKIVARLEERFRAGTVSSIELTTARIAVTKTQVESQNLQRRAEEAMARVAESIGVPASALNDVTIDFPSLRPADTELASTEMRTQALHTRPDILAALAEYAASQSALQLEIAKQYPDVHLGTGYQWDQGEHKWSLGIGMELPVLNRNQGPIAEAKAKRTEAAARFEAAQAKALAEIDLAWASYRGAQTSLRTVESLVGAQQKQQAAVEAQFKAGAADNLEVLATQSELYAAKLLQLDAQARSHAGFGQLEDAIQRPFDALSSVEENPRLVGDKRSP